MKIINNTPYTGSVKFVSYKGNYPDIQNGELILKANDILYTFPKGSMTLIREDDGYGTGTINTYTITFPENYPDDLIDEAFLVVATVVPWECPDKDIHYTF